MRNVLQPRTLFDSSQYHFSQVVTAPAGKLVFVAGQGAHDADGNLVGADDLAAQARQALTNVRLALEAAGATIADLTMLRTYVVNYQPDHVAALLPEFVEFFGDTPPPASTWLGVQSLALPEMLIEIDAQAVVADGNPG